MIDGKAAEASTPQNQPDFPPPSYGPNPPPSSVPYPPQNPPPPSQRAPSAPKIDQDYQTQLFARCAQGLHEPTTKFGPCGIITAIFCFPIGLICLFTDSERRCSRCGIRLG